MQRLSCTKTPLIIFLRNTMFTVWRLIVTKRGVNLSGYCCLSDNPVKKDGWWDVFIKASRGLLMHADRCTLTTSTWDSSPVKSDSISRQYGMREMGTKMVGKKSITFRISLRTLLHTVEWLWAKSFPFREWWLFCSSLVQSYLPE